MVAIPPTEPVSPVSPAAVLEQLTRSDRRPALELARVNQPGVYAWWGEISWPPSFPLVSRALPIYVGKADTEPLGKRASSFHLSRTRGSALRRSLAAVLADELALRPHVVRDARSWGLQPAGEALLTDWMSERLRVTWVVLVVLTGHVDRGSAGDARYSLNGRAAG